MPRDILSHVNCLPEPTAVRSKRAFLAEALNEKGKARCGSGFPGDLRDEFEPIAFTKNNQPYEVCLENTE